MILANTLIYDEITSWLQLQSVLNISCIKDIGDL